MVPKLLLRLMMGLVLAAGFTSCDLFEYHPYEGNIEYQHLTADNLTRIKALEANFSPSDTLRFAFISDTQGFFAETEAMVKDINNRKVDFVIHGGDLTNYAFTDEFERMHQALAKLKMPYLTVIGNHDCLGDGRRLYEKMYGPLNYSFSFGQNKFILINTNFLEFDSSVPDTGWLEQELQQAMSFPNRFVISHIAPDNGEANPEKEQTFARLMRQYQVTLSMHGHTHNYRYEQLYDDGIYYLTTDAAVKRKYILFTVVGNKVTFERINF